MTKPEKELSRKVEIPAQFSPLDLKPQYINQIGEIYLENHPKETLRHSNQPQATMLKEYTGISTSPEDRWRYLTKVYLSLPKNDGSLGNAILALFENAFNKIIPLRHRGEDRSTDYSVQDISQKLNQLIDCWFVGYYRKQLQDKGQRLGMGTTEPEKINNDQIQEIGNAYLTSHGTKPGILHNNQHVALALSHYKEASNTDEKWYFLASKYKEVKGDSITSELGTQIRYLFQMHFQGSIELCHRGVSSYSTYTTAQLAENLAAMVDKHYLQIYKQQIAVLKHQSGAAMQTLLANSNSKNTIGASTSTAIRNDNHDDGNSNSTNFSPFCTTLTKKG